MKDLMLDIETLDTRSTAVIVQIGAVYFDRYTGEIGDTFLVNVNHMGQKSLGFTVGAETLEWWDTQEKTWITDTKEIKPALKEFAQFAEKAKRVWCHATFDAQILIDAYTRLDMKPPFHYTATRDIRTLQDLSGIAERITTKAKKTHNALDDCIYQVEYCTHYFNKLNEHAV